MKKILLGLLFTVLVMGIVGCRSNNVEEITGFSYSSGSTSHVLRFDGNRDNEIINIDFSEFDSGDHNEKNLTISFNDFKNLLNNTNVENCKKHTYDYQCGENDGCSSSSFKVNFENEKSSCYEINTYVVDFFNILKELSYSALTEEEVKNINLIELLEDIKLIKKDNIVKNAKLVEAEINLYPIYLGEGYTINEIHGGDSTDYIIFHNGKLIWEYRKIIPLEEER